ncbi:MAG: L-lactate dehydrogenase [Firmicutes bacterium]|nr:L-lactate dehydrogenase [Bacillota bacterium]
MGGFGVFQKGLKVGVVGSGMVGSSFAYALIITGLATDIVLVDANRSLAEGHAMDLSHGVPFVREVEVIAGSYDDLAGSDIVVVTAGSAQKPGETRLDLIKRNVDVFKDIIPRIAEAAPHCILIIVTNPVDVMTHIAIKLSGFDSHRVIGTGTLLDSARFRYQLSRHCEIDPRNVHAYIIGEHGDSEVPVWSLANIAGMRLTEYCPACPRTCPNHVKEAIFDEVKNAAYHVIGKKGATHWAIGLAMESIVKAVVRDERSVMTVSTLLDDYLGVSGVCLSVPALVGREGILRTFEIKLSDAEMEAFHASAAVIRQAMESIDL